MQNALLKRTVDAVETPFAQVELPYFSHLQKNALSNSEVTMPTAQLAQRRQDNSPQFDEPRVIVPAHTKRSLPLIVRINRILRTLLVASCGLVILCYGLDVALTSEVGRSQEQARRVNEQNSELSAQLLRVISFQGIQDSALGRFDLHVPEQVIVVHEIPAPSLKSFRPKTHSLPVMLGY